MAVLQKFTKGIAVVRLLGLRWALFRLRYALRIRSGAMARRCPVGEWTGKATEATGSYFLPDRREYALRMGQWPKVSMAVLEQADAVCEGRFTFFQAFEKELGIPPDWHRNPVSGEPLPTGCHWSRMGDFAFGDIKNVWEQSRFPWVFPLLRAYWLTADERYPETFWRLVEDWLARNPPNMGVNWKCGQESAIRAMACTFARWGFRESPATTVERLAALDELIVFTASRILGNLDYAVSQNNNHGTSESAVLLGLGLLYSDHPESMRWREIGESTLVSLMKKLVGPDGAFSQHSLNYHRVMLQAVRWVEGVALANEQVLNTTILEALEKAELYLMSYIQVGSGRVPIFGANDGADLLPLHGLGYEDFRPISFGHPDARDPGHPASELSFWLSHALRAPGRWTHENTRDHAIYCSGSCTLYLRRRENWRFRPSHADQLHVDLFCGGEPLLVDSGSYCYNDLDWERRFPSTAFHNTITFDDRDQMPRLSRFLFGNWVVVEKEGEGWRLRDRHGFEHLREVETTDAGFIVHDQVEGRFSRATLRWRLSPDLAWNIEGGSAVCSLGCLELDVGGDRVRIEQGYISEFYGVMRPLEVLCVDLVPGQSIRSIFRVAP